MNNIVNVKPVIVADAPEAHQVWLDAGCQHFTIGEYCETKDEAEWLASQLRIALANTASQSSRGEAVYQWREIGEREWREAPSKEFFDNRDSDPTCDTRILYTESCVVAGEVVKKWRKEASEVLGHENQDPWDVAYAKGKQDCADRIQSALQSSGNVCQGLTDEQWSDFEDAMLFCMNNGQDFKHAARAYLAALPAAGDVPAGWILVPIEPNWDMRNEGREFLIEGVEKEPEKLAYFLWKTMLAASPKELEKRDAAIDNAQATEGK